MEEKVVKKAKNGTSAQRKQSAAILNSNISFIQHISVPKYSTKNSATKKWPTNLHCSNFCERASFSHKSPNQLDDIPDDKIPTQYRKLTIPQITPVVSWDTRPGLSHLLGLVFPAADLSQEKKNKKSCRPSRHIERRVKKLRLLIAFAQISLASFACRPCSAFGVLSRPTDWRGGS